VHQPRILLLDLSMPGGSSLDAIPELAAGPTDVDLLDAIRLAASGGTYVNPRMRAQLAARAGLVRYAFEHALVEV
jgi:DNA-binding NarL/FixJ family response regulator